MIGTMVLAGGACAAVWAGGYLIGVRKGGDARGALRTQLDAQQRQVHAADLRAHGAEARADAQALVGPSPSSASLTDSIREELHEALAQRLAPLADRNAEMQRLSAQVNQVMEKLGDRQPRMTGDLQRLLAPVMAQARETAQLREEIQRLNRPVDRHAEDARLKRVVADAIRPITEHVQLGAALANVDSGTGRADLNGLLDAVARKAGFSSVLLSDASGLLLAANRAAVEPELRAGISSLLVTLNEQFIKADQPAPRAVVIHDAANQIAVSRIFTVDGACYLLTAVTSGREVPPTVLDPVLEKIESLMGDWTMTSSRSSTRPLAHAS
jgi:hypothetical protein